MTTTSANSFDSGSILDGIRRWVEIETPTDAPEQVNKLADLVAAGYRDLPATVERIAGQSGCGDHLVARSAWGQSEPGILVLSHLDTVHPMGFIERLPFKIEGDVAFGPGIYDMKGGAYLAYHAFRQVCANGARSPLGVTQLYVSDEEIGSPTSRALIEAEGRKAKYVLVTEPARDGGKIVTGRKGVGRFEIFIRGVPSHAGTRPGDGRSAIRELGNIIQTLEAMNDLKRGITVNVGVVRGGTRPNVIAEEAYAEVDMRVPTIADSDELVPKILGLKSRTDGVTVKVMGELNRPPYEKGNAGAALYEHAKTLAAEIGFDLVDTSTGGGSDGNFTAPHTATLDGLGVDGKGAHTHYEQMYISSIEPRARLLHRLYQTLR
ncbi:M20 family metallopeptidase [Bradyrhizobium sp. Ash2021]|uniref:M20 family metallopeptidase n=1 Tax=Bradyrhizobium sp. Ash2021 TaxID=2954771 RepID=UPI002815C9D4|nr:M20 family metallopeptidase [Bradyrhizobium sp. Ash2021]WMT74910.1 M20 family metallopeptidase [Bradyrhizobium sp. Ash2021]